MFEKWRIKQHMEVTDAAGQHIGTVDEVDGDQIKLTRSDSSDSRHHFLPFDSVDKVEDNRIYLKAGAAAPQFGDTTGQHQQDGTSRLHSDGQEFGTGQR